MCTLFLIIVVSLGGNKGFDKVLWEVVEHKDGDHPSITFKYQSRDGEEGLFALNLILVVMLRIFSRLYFD